MGLDIINTIKKKRGLTNEELSSLSGIPKATLDKITSGTTTDPKLETLKAIAHALGCSLNDFDEPSPIHKGDSVLEGSLSPDEKAVLYQYRQLPDSMKEDIRDYVAMKYEKATSAACQQEDRA